MASVLLEKAITIANTDPNPLLDAVFWSEVGITLEKGFIRDDVPTPPTSLLKNAGLGHAHIVQNKLIKEGEKYGEYPIPQSFDVFQTILGPEVDWPTDKKCVLMHTYSCFLNKKDLHDNLYRVATFRLIPASYV